MRKILTLMTFLLLFIPNFCIGGEYQVVSVVDDSFKGIVRKQYKIIVPSGVSKQGLKETFKKVVKDETLKKSKLAEITIFAYDRKEDVASFYTMGKCIWAPNGKWGGSLKTRDESAYKFTFDIMKKVGATSGKPTDRELKIHDAFHKALWKDPDVPEEVVTKKVAKEFGISEDELIKIYGKVEDYKMK